MIGISMRSENSARAIGCYRRRKCGQTGHGIKYVALSPLNRRTIGELNAVFLTAIIGFDQVEPFSAKLGVVGDRKPSLDRVQTHTVCPPRAFKIYLFDRLYIRKEVESK